MPPFGNWKSARPVEIGAYRSASWLVGAFPQEHHHARMNTVTQPAKCMQAFFIILGEGRRVFERPVEPLCFSRESWALFTRLVTDRENEAELLSLKFRDWL